MTRAPLIASEAPLRASRSNYPEPFASRLHGRFKRPLGELFGLKNFGVNVTTLEPGAISALQHQHSQQDEFVYVLDGELVLVSGMNEWVMSAGWCVGFPAGGNSHHLENRSSRPATYLEIGDRAAGDVVSYPCDDLVAVLDGGTWRFTHKNGERY
jgi:uncharacterized cupin superfamily protein